MSYIKDREIMLWRGASHFIQGIFKGLVLYMEAKEVSQEIKDHVNYLKSEIENEIEKVKKETAELPNNNS